MSALETASVKETELAFATVLVMVKEMAWVLETEKALLSVSVMELAKVTELECFRRAKHRHRERADDILQVVRL